MTSSDGKVLTFDGDRLERKQFTDRLIQYIIGLADSESAALPAGRVIAVNAPWGAGKSWVAERLATQLKSNQRIQRPGIYVNAFEFDFHQDPLAVLASAILNQASATNAAKAGLKEATKTVLKESLPVLLKGAMKTGVTKLVGDEAFQDVADTLADSTEKTLEALIDTFAATQRSGQAFRSKLAEFAQSTSGSLVVIVDELDRCRPTFALDLLERVKHLFDVPNVVFVLFFHRDAMASVIHQMYGTGINTDAYLRKFISLNIELPTSIPSSTHRHEESKFIHDFIRSALPGPRTDDESRFRKGLAELAPLFHATLRDVQTIMLMNQLLDEQGKDGGEIGAYVLLLRLFTPDRLLALQKEGSTPWGQELERFSLPGTMAERPNWFQELVNALRMKSDPRERAGMPALERANYDEIVRELIHRAALSRLEHIGLQS